MSIDIDPEGLCKKCRDEHEIFEANAGRTMPVQPALMCQECKEKNGIEPGGKTNTPGTPEGDDTMKRKKRKYTRRADKTAVEGGKTSKARLSRETRKLIKGILKSGKKAEKLEAKANKLQDRADELRVQAANMKAEIDALKDAVNQA
jgi:hypothetical protein